MAPEGGGSVPQPRKVRSACRRCRTKRIKCDGGVPACTNCARANVSCIDVQTGNIDMWIPRDFATRCCSRIKWLEQQVKSLSSDFDLSEGPQVEMDFLENFTAAHEAARSDTANADHRSGLPEQHMPRENLEEPVTYKRSHSTMESEARSSVSANARSVANDLGKLSLQSDSREKHYLGSSSGLLFTKLMGLDNERSIAQSTFQTRQLASLCDSDEKYRSLYDQLQRELPSPQDACVLLEVYFRDIHIDQPFLHPVSLINAYQALRKCAQYGHKGSVDRNGWSLEMSPFSYNGKMANSAGHDTTPVSIFTAVFHVFMVFSLAATVLTRKKQYEYSPMRFQRMAMSAASETFSNISVPSLQGILLLVAQSLIGPAGVNVWTLSYLAMSHCIDLGLHREPSESEMSKTATTVMRFIFYTVYSLDRSISTIQGRPLGIRDESFDIRLPDLNDIEEMAAVPNLDIAIRLPTAKLLALSIFRFHLDQHVSEIKLLLYHLPDRVHDRFWPTNYSEIQMRIKDRLDQWLADVQAISLDGHLQEEEEIKLKFEKIRLEQLYHSTITLLFQPSQMIPSPSQNALSLCYQSCSRRVQLYDACASQEILYYNWRNMHGIFSSGATIIYCAWVSRDLQQTLPIAKLFRDLRICSNHLSIGSQWWPSVRSGRDRFEMMIDLIINYYRDLEIRDSNPPPQRRIRTKTGQTDNGGYDVSTGPLYPTTKQLDDHSMSRSVHSVDGMPFGHAGFQNENTFTTPLGQAPPSIAANPDLSISSNSSNSLNELEVTSMEAAMESFIAEYLHEDWGWDPFSRPTGLLDDNGAGASDLPSKFVP